MPAITIIRKFTNILAITVFLLAFFLLAAEASIILKVLAVNPSKDQVQKIQVKTYLPKETKPEDVLSKEDLEIAYDTQQGSYYAYGEYELKPTEVLEKSIELRDIWTVSSTEIESLRNDAIKLNGLLKNTEFADRASFLINNIESKLNQIIENQKTQAANPERHISDYRDNLKTIESAKADLALVRSLLARVKSFPTVAIWRLILFIVIFLGLLGASFYFIWHKQLKVVAKETLLVPPKEE